jgi:hypothetical protein
MKKLLLSLLLLPPSLSYADTVTQGYVGLLQVSTGVVDPNRNWGDKYNANFGIVAASMTSLSNRNSVIVGYDEGTRQGDITALNVTGTGVDLTVSGTTGTINVTASGGGGASSLAIATGSAQASNIISSPTSIVNFSSGVFKVRFISPSTAYIDIDYSSITAQGRISATGGGSDNLGSHVATNTLHVPYGFTASSGIVLSSLTAYGIISSTAGFIGGRSTFSAIALGANDYTHLALTFGSDPNTGFYSNSNGVINIMMDGEGIGQFDAGGLTIMGIDNQFLGTIDSGGRPAYSYTNQLNSGLTMNYSEDVGIVVNGAESLMSRVAGYNESVSSFTSKLVVTSSNGYIGGSSTLTRLNVSNSILFDSSVQSTGTSLNSSNLIIGTSDYSQGSSGIFLAANQTTDSSGYSSPIIKFITNADGAIGPTINPILSSFTIRMDLDSTFPHNTTSSQLKVVDVNGAVVAAFRHGSSGILTSNLSVGDTSGLGSPVILTTFMSTASAQARALENRISTGTLVYNGGINITALAFGGSASGSQTGSTLTITATGGAGGGGGGVSLQSGASVVSVSTFLFPGATITSDGQGASSVTFTPEILSTFTALTSTAAYMTNQFTAIFSSNAALGISTQNIQSFYSGISATTSLRIDEIQIDLSTTAVDIDNLYTSVNSTWNFTNVYMSTADARGNTFQNFRSTTDIRLTDAHTFAAASSTILNNSTAAIAVTLANATTKYFSIIITSPSAQDDFPIFKTFKNIEISSFSARCSSGTNVVGALYELDNVGSLAAPTRIFNDVTVTASAQATQTSFTNQAVDAGDWVGWFTTSVSGDVRYLSITVTYVEK